MQATIGPSFSHDASDEHGQWDGPAAAADMAFSMARSGLRDEALALVDHAYGLWADAAEIEIVMATGAEPRKRGERGRAPKMIWAPLVEAPKKSNMNLDSVLTTEIGRIRMYRDQVIECQKILHGKQDDGRRLKKVIDELLEERKAGKVIGGKTVPHAGSHDIELRSHFGSSHFGSSHFGSSLQHFGSNSFSL